MYACKWYFSLSKISVFRNFCIWNDLRTRTVCNMPTYLGATWSLKMNEALRQSQMAAKRQVEEGLRLNSVATRALQDEQLNTSKDWTMPQCHRLKMCSNLSLVWWKYTFRYWLLEFSKGFDETGLPEWLHGVNWVNNDERIETFLYSAQYTAYRHCTYSTHSYTIPTFVILRSYLVVLI